MLLPLRTFPDSAREIQVLPEHSQFPVFATAFGMVYCLDEHPLYKYIYIYIFFFFKESDKIYYRVILNVKGTFKYIFKYIFS